MRKHKYLFILIFTLTFLYPNQSTTATGSIEYYFMTRLSNSDLVNIPFRLINLNIYHQRDNIDVNGSLALEYRPRVNTDFLIDEDPTDFSLVLRELYVNYYLDNGEVSFGKKIFSWASSDENSPLDNINPYDYYYLLNGTNERKLGIYSGSFDFYFGDNWKVSGMFSPMHNTNRYPINNSAYPIDLPISPALEQIIDIKDKNHYQTGLHIQKSLSKSDISIAHLRAYDKVFSPTGFILFTDATQTSTYPATRYSYRLTEVTNLGLIVLLNNNFTIRSDFSYFKTFDRNGIDELALERPYESDNIFPYVIDNGLQIRDAYPFKESVEYTQGVIQFEIPLEKDYQINIQYFNYKIQDYKNLYSTYGLNPDTELPNLPPGFDVSTIGTEELFTPGMGAPYSLLSKRLGLIVLEKLLLDNDLKITFSTLYDLDEGDGHLYAFESEYEFNNGLSAIVGFNKINGDSSQGSMYRLNVMEDFSSFRTQITYNF